MALTWVSLLTGGVFLVAGLIQLRFPPRSINHIYGYRTARSMKSEENWHFAQRYSARLMIGMGLILGLVAAVGTLVHIPDSLGATLPTILLLAMVIGMIARVERALKKRSGE
ncbi:MAG: SdpI family protein [Haliscomenobacter sp.]